MKLESFSRWLFLYHQESGKQCPRIAIRLLALLVGDSPSPFEHRISFCGCAFLRNAFHLPAAVRKYEKTGASAVLPLFLFPVILAFLPVSHQPVHIGFCGQQFPHFLAGSPVLGMPDPALCEDDLKNCGYQDGDLLPLSKERALELFEQDLTVYAVVDGGGAEMLFDREEFESQLPGTVFALSREEWEESPAFDALVQERLNRQQEREQAFLSHEGDCFAIYQVSREDPQNVRFMNLDWLKSHDIPVDRGNYDLIYTAPLGGSGTKMEQLEKLYEQFNLQKPVDFHSPSMSVSDIVAVKRDGMVSCHYCDSVGFTEIPGFLPDNPLKNAEMSMEDDYGMIDGIINNGPKEPTVAQLEQQARSGQPISLMDLADAVHREEQDKRKSVVEQLHQQPKQESKKTAPKKSAEREL